MFNRITGGFASFFERYLPDPFVLVLMITIAVFVAGIAFEGRSPIEMLDFWQDGFWDLLSFAMQMSLMLIVGYTVASTPQFKLLVGYIASYANTPTRALLIVSITSLVVTWVNWGVGLVTGAILAREMARRVHGIDYRLLVASAYGGFIIWHAGLSGSAPLLVATPGYFLEDKIGIVSTSHTIFSPINLVICAAILVIVPLLFWLMSRGIENPVTVDPNALEDNQTNGYTRDREESVRPAERLERSKWLAWITAFLGFASIIVYAVGGGGLNLNIVIFALIFIGLAMHGSAQQFLSTLNEGVRGATGVVIQFPFYAGIMGMMASSGLAASIATWFVNISSAHTLPLMGFISAGLINIIIPSGSYVTVECG